MPFLNDYFYYTRRERYAVLVFLIALILLLIYRIALPYLHTPDEPEDFTQFKADLKAFQESLRLREEARPKYNRAYANSYSNRPKEPSPIVLEPAPFNPNTASAEQLNALGLPERTVRSIVNYRNKGGQFRYKSDFAKIYTLAPQHYQQLAPFLQLPEKRTSSTPNNAPSPPLPPAFPFDPNTCTKADWQTLGLPERTIRSILNYRNKGGQFRKPEDLQKIYTLPDSIYQHLAPFIQLAEQPTFANQHAYKARTYQRVDINQASEADFQQFRGIGPSYAKRMIAYRERLGGFLSIDQVSEVYRLPDSTFQHIRPFLDCSPIAPYQINVNTATLEALKDHPYLSWSQARAIIHYREHQGPWKSVELLQILPELDDGNATFERVQPYLSVN